MVDLWLIEFNNLKINFIFIFDVGIYKRINFKNEKKNFFFIIIYEVYGNGMLDFINIDILII